jgi:uncharacterized protein (UPF0333 family)
MKKVILALSVFLTMTTVFATTVHFLPSSKIPAPAQALIVSEFNQRCSNVQEVFEVNTTEGAYEEGHYFTSSFNALWSDGVNQNISTIAITSTEHSYYNGPVEYWTSGFHSDACNN